jgi:mRNA-degrading endonuclease RelE of RelBE toxin-antitoxin system
LPRAVATQVLAKIMRLAQTGAPNVKVLQGQQGERRLRAGDYRVRFTESGDGIRVHSVRHRREAYR